MIDLTPMRDDMREELRTDLYKRRISVTSVARFLGLSRVQVSRILNGESDTTFDNWEKIAALVDKRFMLEKVSEAPPEGDGKRSS